LRGVEVRALEPHLGAECAHRRDLERVGGGGGEYGDEPVPASGGTRESLAEVTGRRADDWTWLLELREKQLRAAALEGTDGIQRLDLARELDVQRPVERRPPQQRGMEEDRVDDGHRPSDVIGGWQ